MKLLGGPNLFLLLLFKLIKQVELEFDIAIRAWAATQINTASWFFIGTYIYRVQICFSTVVGYGLGDNRLLAELRCARTSEVDLRKYTGLQHEGRGAHSGTLPTADRIIYGFSRWLRPGCGAGSCCS